ncbi:MAG: FAD-binding protein [Terracidiphilus sp.]|jgi:glycerol-3-phosphate dehydrogenase subunit B
METDRYDIVVVGAGLSGLVAAGAAAHRKLKVALVATGPGSFVTGPAWLKAQEIPQESAAPELKEAIAFFYELARLAGCPYAGDISTARSLPTVLGDFQSVALAPLTLWNAEPREGASTAIIGVRGLSSFDENFMAERLTEQARLIGSGGTYTARQIFFSRDMGVPVTTLRIAQCFDRDSGFREELIDALRSAASGFARVLVPGILGLESSAEKIAEFVRELGCLVGEIPTLPPSIPGLRIYHCLESYLHKIGVELYRGFPVEQVVIHDGLCTGLRVATPGHSLNLHCQSAVLATSRHSASPLGGEYAGCDEQMRPRTSSGSVMARNLIIAGPPPHSSDHGNAMHILTGYRAENLAASIRGNHAAR